MSSPSRLEAFLAEPRNMILAGIRKDGRPHLTPNWFYWDGTKFYVSTTRNRAKYAVFRRDPRAELLVDDSIGYRYVRISGMVEIREDIPAELPRFRAIREKHGRRVPPDADLAAQLIAESRVLLAVTPSGSPSTWTTVGLD
jgi:PPOX class probable F420-dependent enzyme